MTTLIAYFSRAGKNYVSGDIVDLKIGNTQVIADMLHDSIPDSDMFKISTIAAYSDNYKACCEQAKEEKSANNRPKLRKHVEDMSKYDTVFIGYPNWCGTAPMAVFTFLEENNMAGKLVVPFCTHEGTGLGSSEEDIKKACPKSKVLHGHAFFGTTVKDALPEMAKWLSELPL